MKTIEIDRNSVFSVHCDLGHVILSERPGRPLMAIFTTAIPVSDIRNSIGGVTFSKGPFGNFIRERVIPTNPQSSGQADVRGNFTTLATAWRGLTDNQRAAWAAYAATVQKTNSLGQPYNPLPLNAFISGNSVALQAGAPQVSAGPTTPGLSPSAGTVPAQIAVDASLQTIASADSSLAFPNWSETTDDDVVAVYCGLSRTTSIGFYSGPYRFAGAVVGNLGTPPTDFSFSVPFPVTTGQLVRCRFVRVTPEAQMPAEDVIDFTVVA